MVMVDLCAIAIAMVFTGVTVNGEVIFPITKPNNEWWSNSIMYQIYPMSFKDSNDDGVGDLKGITQKLDHFVDLGIDILWIGPMFKSPMDDMGYDVEDYKMIDPIFGTMDDFMQLISEMNKRNLKLITDIVPNHSSYKCEWFQKSVKREGKYTDYYMWQDAKNQYEVLRNSSVTPIPPNNWLNVFGGSGWTWNEERKQFYYHQFNFKQPDYNIRNPNVHKELLDIMEFWMDKGVVGFRFDALKHLYENASLTDEEYREGKEDSTNYDDMIHTYTTDQPETIEILYSWREFIDDYTKRKNLSLSRIISTESYSSMDTLMQYYGNETKLGAQIPFNFGFVGINRDHLIDSVDKSIKLWLSSIPTNMVANWVMENHDNPRMATKFGPESVPLFIALQLILPGVDVTYYGGEIGMDNTYVRHDQIRDPNNAGGAMSEMTRDNERCPMQWDDSINAGFTRAKKPWLPINPNYYKLNVEKQKKIPTSTYNFYKKMSKLRKTETFKNGDVQTYNISQSIYILIRSLPEYESYIVVINFGSETETVIMSNVIKNIKDKLYVYLGSENVAYNQGSIIHSNGMDGSLELRPLSVVVLTDKGVINNQSLNSASRSIQSSSRFISLLCITLLIKFFI